MKNELIAVIEAYAAAKATGNSLLQELAAAQVRGFLAAVDVTPIEVEPEVAASEEGDASEEGEPGCPLDRPEAAAGE